MLAPAFPDCVYNPHPPSATGTVVLAGGCFWCVEGAMRNLRGVTAVVSGYTGGNAETANYKDVCEGTTGHAEAVQIHFNTATTSLGEILKVFFWLAHDPTQLNRQGHDRGTQYRSAIFYADEMQKQVASRYMAQLEAAGIFQSPIVTTLEPLGRFYPAEAYHQNYAALHPHEGYIKAVAAPKIEKVKHYMAGIAKNDSGQEG